MQLPTVFNTHPHLFTQREKKQTTKQKWISSWDFFYSLLISAQLVKKKENYLILSQKTQFRDDLVQITRKSTRAKKLLTKKKNAS